MATGSAIYNESQTYGNGIIQIQGGFTDNGSAAVVAHGKGFTVTRGTTGVYKVVLQAGLKGIHSTQAEVAAGAATGNASFSHPGFAISGDLQSDGVTFYIYTYAFNGTQAYMASTSTICQFSLIGSISSLNP